MEELTKLLRAMNEKLGQMDERLSKLEGSKVVLDERKVIAAKGELEGKTYFSTGDGGIVKELRVPVCDACGKASSEFNACTGCGKKLCPQCSITFQATMYCVDCLNGIIPLSKQEFKLLSAMAADLGQDAIHDLIKMPKDDLKTCEANLVERQMIEKKGFLFFQECKVLDRGIEALAAYRQVYGREEDITNLEEKLRRRKDGEE